MQIRMPWWGVLGLFIATLIIFIVFDHYGRDNLTLPAMASGFVLGFTVGVKWKLRLLPWFWITMAVLVALHVIFLVFIPWTHEWVPAVVSALIASADVIIMLAVIDTIARLVRRAHA